MEREQVTWSRGAAQRPQFGLVLFEDDPVSGPTLQQLFDPMGVDVQPARIDFPGENDPVDFAARLRAAAASILPSTPPSVIGFACTTGAIELGEVRVRAALSRPGASIAAVTPIDGAVAALHALGARRVAIVSPYAEAASTMVGHHFAISGFPVTRLAYFGAGNDQIAAISADSIRAAARSACADGQADALFLSCTGMRATPLIAVLEDELGIPVLTSLQLMAWQAAPLLGVNPTGPGRLFDTSPSNRPVHEACMS